MFLLSLVSYNVPVISSLSSHFTCKLVTVDCKGYEYIGHIRYEISITLYNVFTSNIYLINDLLMLKTELSNSKLDTNVQAKLNHAFF